jgi:hypothetical protein
MDIHIIIISNTNYAASNVIINNLCIKSYPFIPTEPERILECDYAFPVCASCITNCI